MPQIQVNLYVLFLPFLAIFIVTTIMMARIAKKFITKNNRPFSIFNLEFPGSDENLSSLVLKMNDDVKQSVKKHLYVDYVFMAGVYPGIAILCFIAAGAADSEIGSKILLAMGWLQIVPWICDIIENIILLKKINHPLPIKENLYRLLKYLVGTKFFIAVLGVISTIFSLVYIWLIGGIPEGITQIIMSLTGIVILVILIFALIRRAKRHKLEREEKRLGKSF